MMDRRDILYAALMGSKVSAPERMRAVQNELMKVVGPMNPFVPFIEGAPTVPAVTGNAMDNLWQSDAPVGKDGQFFYLELEATPGIMWTLPYEPMISVSGKNNIIRRNVAKMGAPSNEARPNAKNMGGTVKERWSVDDYEITITGVLYGAVLMGKPEECFPREDFVRMINMLRDMGRIKVHCKLLEYYGINHIVIENYSFPFSKGNNVQAYELKGYSDFEHNLLIPANA